MRGAGSAGVLGAGTGDQAGFSGTGTRGRAVTVVGWERQDRLQKLELNVTLFRRQSMEGLCRRSQGVPRTMG